MKESKPLNIIYGKSLLCLIIIFFLTLNNIYSASWYHENWTYRKKITFADNIDTIPAQQTDFPVLISITDLNIKNNATDTGYDILFADSDGITKLAHEIEYYDSGTGQLICWVKIPVLSTGVSIYMYYGNLASANQQDIYNVWDNNYVGVWHKNDSTSTTVKDSSGNNNHGTKKSAVEPFEVEGKILKAQNYNGDTGFITIPHDNSLNFNEMTISAWINYDTAGSVINDWPTIARKETGTAQQDGWGFMINKPDRYIRFNLNNLGGINTANNIINNKIWYHVTLTHSFDTTIIYVNGNYTAASSFNANIMTNIQNLTIGSSPMGSRVFNGIIDELRISNIPRSVDWIKSKYNNQNDPSTFYEISVEQKNTDISIYYPPNDNYDTNVINITVSGTVVNYYEGDTVEIFVGDNLQDTVFLSGVGTDTNWNLNITLIKPSDSITVRLIDINGNQYFDTITITKLLPDIPTDINAAAVLEGSDTGVLLSWSHNTDPDTAGYNIYRTSDPLIFSDTINQLLITDTNSFFDTNVVQGETYFYKIRCVDKVGNVSPQSDSITASSVKIKLSVDTYGRTLPGDTLTLYFNYYNDGFGPAYGANLFYNIPGNLIFDTFVPNVNNVSDTYIESLQRLQWQFNSPILPKLESDSKSLRVILKIK